MDERTERLKNIIIERYGSIREFSKKVNIPSTTLTSALDRGIGGMSVERVVAICEILDLDIRTFKPLQEKPLTSITDKEKELLSYYNQLNDLGKDKLINDAEDLTHNTKYCNVVELPSKDEDEYVPHTIAAHADGLTKEENEANLKMVLEHMKKLRK